MTRTLLLAILLAAVPATMQAQLACGPRDKVLITLEGKYGESRIGLGLVGETMIFELWASNTTGTWTFTKTTPDGITCIMVVGSSWINDLPDYEGYALPIRKDIIP